MGGGEVVDYRVLPVRGERIDRAEFRMWLPEGSGSLRGIWVLLMGTNQSALGLVDEPLWREWATRQGVALVGVYLLNENGNYDWPETGSGRALVDALEYFSGVTGRGELREVPIYLAGFSQGGQFAYHFALWNPGRVGGFVTVKGGKHRMPEGCKKKEGDEAEGAVPGVLIAGEEDADSRRENLEQVAEAGERMGMPWVSVVEPKTGHELGQSARLIVSFFAWQMGDLGKGEWEGRLGKFRGGKAMEAIPCPPMEETEVVEILVHPQSSVDLGEADVREREWVNFEIDLMPKDAGGAVQEWEVVADREGIDGKVEKEGAGWKLRGSVEAGRLPLGLFKGRLRLYPSIDGKAVSGGGRVEVTLRVTGGVRAEPASLFVGVLRTGETKEGKIRLLLRPEGCDGERGTVMGVEVPEGVEAGEGREIVGGWEFPVRVDAGRFRSGRILWKVKSDREWDIAVPVIGTVKKEE